MNYRSLSVSHMPVSLQHYCEYKGVPASCFAPSFFPYSHCETQIMYLCDAMLSDRRAGCSCMSADLLRFCVKP